MERLHPCVVILMIFGLSSAALAEDRFVVDSAARQILVRQDGRLVRLIGVEPVLGDADGERARDAVVRFLADLVGDDPLRLEIDPTVSDETGTAAYAFLQDGRMVNLEMVRAGFARATTVERHRYRIDLVLAEREATESFVGLWRVMAPSATAEPPPLGDQEVYRIFYATDRKPTGSVQANEYFGADRGSGLVYGSCDVSIPKDHRMGEMERPSIWRLELREDPERHVVLLSIHERATQDFFNDLSEQVMKSAGKEALVFVHGYNVDFAEAARRTAQLAYDLGFDGAPILYSWPSRGTLTGYTADATTADWSAPHLEAFLENLAARSGATTVHLIAHSMGNRVLAQALRVLAMKPHEGPAPRFSQVVLTAPDIDAQAFKEQIAPAIHGTAERITLYASSEDEALKASKEINGAPRAGDSGSAIVVLDGIDTIDVSAVDTTLVGHSYFADNRSVISDLFNLIRQRKAPSERFGLVQVPSGDLVYWAFRP